MCLIIYMLYIYVYTCIYEWFFPGVALPPRTPPTHIIQGMYKYKYNFKFVTRFVIIKTLQHTLWRKFAISDHPSNQHFWALKVLEKKHAPYQTGA